jgi:hypothetical protein
MRTTERKTRTSATRNDPDVIDIRVVALMVKQYVLAATPLSSATPVL